MYGTGTAEFRGRLSGTGQWSNFPRLHAGHALPHANGVLPLGADSFVLFSVSGLSSLTGGSGIHVMRFQTEDAEHDWLNTVVSVGEGSVDAERGVLAMRYYRCVVDHLPALPV
jgi:hypothetical protein